MKKIALSLIVAGFLGNVFAADTTALTEATVKLIKNQQHIMADIQNIQNYIENNTKEMINHSQNLDDIKQNIEKLKHKTNINTINVGLNKKSIDDIYTKLHNMQNVVSEDKVTVNNAIGFMKKMKEFKKSIENNLTVIDETSRQAYTKSTDALKQVQLLSQAMEKLSKKVNNINTKLDKLSATIKEMKQSCKDYKLATNTKLKALETKIHNMDKYYEAEIEMLKTKTSLHHIKVPKIINCKGNNCGKTSKSVDDTISDFIQN